MTEPDVTALMTVAQAIAEIDRAPVVARIATMPLLQSLGLRLAKEIRADRDSPPFDKSLMDGYALRFADAARAPCDLPVVGHIAAGSAARQPLGDGQAMAIMTGAPMPARAEIVIPVEDTEPIESGSKVRIKTSHPGNRFIAAAGSDVRQGAIVLPKDIFMGAAQIAVAASVGAAAVDVYRPATTAVLGTGDEIVPIDQTPGPAQIRGSNNAMLIALLQKLGSPATDLGFCPDTRDATRHAILNGLKNEILFITGGMSMGERDYVPGILKELGANFRVTKLRIKPGKPFVFAIMPDGKFVFGLPGNPVSAYVCTLRLASRLLEKFTHGSPISRVKIIPLSEPLPANGPREFYQPAQIIDGSAKPLNWKGSADIFTLANANALLIRPENETRKEAGDPIQVIELP